MQKSGGSIKALIFSLEFPPFAGGAGIYTAGLAKGLSLRGANITALVPAYTIVDSKFDQEQPFKIIRMALPKMRLLKLAVASFYLVMNTFILRPDVVLITDSWAQIVASLCQIVIRKPFFVTVHGTEVYTHFKRNFLIFFPSIIQKFFSRAKAIICISQATKCLLLKTLPNLDDRVVVIHNGIDLDRIKPVDDFFVKKLKKKLNATGPILLTVARLIPEKGVDSVIKSLVRIVPDISNLKYVIVGEGSDKMRLKTLVKDLSLENNVVFVGQVLDEELPVYYSLSDIFIMVSRPGRRFEGFGLVYAEASAYGKPVIAGRIGGVPEVVRDGYNGVLVDPYNIDEIEQAIRKLLLNLLLAIDLGRKGRKLVLDEFNVIKMSEKTLSVIQNYKISLPIRQNYRTA